MRLTRSLPAMVTALLAAFLATGVAAQTVLRFGHANSPGEVAHDLYKEFADNVTKKSGGQLTVRVFPSEQLGKEVDLLQQLKSGALDISSPSMPTLNSMVPASSRSASAPSTSGASRKNAKRIRNAIFW